MSPRRLQTLAAMAVLAISIYILARTVYVAAADCGTVDRVFGWVLLLVEGFLLAHATGFAMNVYRTSGEGETPEPPPVGTDSAPEVAVAVASRHEPLAILEKTFTTLCLLDYPKKRIYLLDDSSGEQYQREADDLAERMGFEVYRREVRHGAKAGIINDALRDVIHAKHLVLFDADQNPMPDFLSRTIPVLEADERVAWVQTPQVYTNLGAGPVAYGSAMQQAIFYESICEGKTSNQAIFCCGTNVVFRVSALRQAGGFDESSITEDFATSIKLHMLGHRSVYHNHACAFGMAPESFPAYLKQQSRWAVGTLSMLRKVLWYALTNWRSLSPGQWWEYFLASSFYLTGWANFFLMLCPVVYLLWGVPTAFMQAGVYLTAYVPYFTLSWLVFYSTMRSRHYTLRQVVEGVTLGYLCFPVLMKAAVFGLVLNRRMPFVVTTKGKAERFPFLGLWPYWTLLGVNAAAVAAGLAAIESHPYAKCVNVFWALYHCAILAQAFRFNHEPTLGT
ncbi:MAG: glycosyltransferase [Elusimicrobia bacterium]|nr:glycosyltransferase [Elusimicrobiota bacterium]